MSPPSLRQRGRSWREATITRRDANYLSVADVDFYPVATGGLHFLGMAAVSEVSVDGGALGYGFGLGLGYDWWVTDKVSIGVLGRFNYLSVSRPVVHLDSGGDSGDGQNETAIAPAPPPSRLSDLR